MKKVHFLDTVKIYYYNKDKPIQKSIDKKKVKIIKLYNLENNSCNYIIVIMILVILSIIYIIIMG